jgi:prepilin-type N-terminal cleavage/methylation domain-containing protein
MERRKSGEASNYGFTLIELLIVIVVLGVLAAIVVFSLGGVTGQSHQAACTTDAQTINVAADEYQAKTGNWPATVGIAGLVTNNYLHSAPATTNGYTITIGATNVDYTPTGGTLAVFNSTTGCQNIK